MWGCVRVTCVGICLTAGLLSWIPRAEAHGIVGNRMFIEPLTTEDANVKNELVLPSAEFLVQPDGNWRTVGFSLEKALYPGRFSLVLEDERSYQHEGGLRSAGWDNLELGVKWEAATNELHEFVLSPALFVTFPTSSTNIIPHQTALRPMLLYGKGFGDLRAPWLRPFAIQGDVGFQSSLTGPTDRQVVYDEVLMYSIPYLNHWVRQADAGYSLEDNLRRGFSRGAVFGNLFPFAELNATTPVGGTGGGTSAILRPGIAWMGKYVQISVAADLVLKSPDVGPRHPGAGVLVDWFLDEIFAPLGWTPFGGGAHHH